MAVVQAMGFSPNGEYLAFSSPDGTLKLWDTQTGTLKQEYTPSSHLSATCSCLSWAPSRHNIETPKKKKKRRKSSSDTCENSDLIALGTTSGSVLLYSLLKGDLNSQLIGGHTDVVHCVCWHPDGDTLYTCSGDGHIVQWSLSSAKVKFKWKADRGSVYSLCLTPSGSHLLSASRKIKLWDTETRELIKTFSGHAAEVFQLLSVPVLSPEHTNGDTEGPIGCFLSAAVSDRLLHAWNVSPSAQKTAVSSFSLTDEPIFMTLQRRTLSQALLLAVVTKRGDLHIFEHTFNGPGNKPVKPSVTLQIASDSVSTPQPIPIVGVHLYDDEDSNVLVAHGNMLHMTYEKCKYSSLDAHTCLLRADPVRTAVRKEEAVSKVKTPQVSGDVTVLGPGHMAPSVPTQSTSNQDGAAGKRRRKKSIEMTLDERLNAISIDKSSSKPGTEAPRADTLATLLSQGLQSKDKKILNSVLQHTDERIIRNTVRRLPVQVIVPLVEELSKRMHGHAQSGHTLVRWMKTVLTIHSSYLMTFPELVHTLSSIYQMMESRVSLFTRLSKLQGKLDLMLSQVSSQGSEEEDVSSQQPLLLYQDDSSDEDAEDLMAPHSESENDWEDDVSDMEMENRGESGDEDANGDEDMSDSD